MRTKSYLTPAETRIIMAGCQTEAVRCDFKCSIAITDEAGFLLHFERVDGGPMRSVDPAIQKARTAALYARPTKDMQDKVKDHPSLLSVGGRAMRQGGLPILYRGECVGGVGVSGLDSALDEQVAQAGLDALAKAL